MKKLLGLLGSIAVVATGATAVVSCAPEQMTHMPNNEGNIPAGRLSMYSIRVFSMPTGDVELEARYSRPLTSDELNSGIQVINYTTKHAVLTLKKDDVPSGAKDKSGHSLSRGGDILHVCLTHDQAVSLGQDKYTIAVKGQEPSDYLAHDNYSNSFTIPSNYVDGE